MAICTCSITIEDFSEIIQTETNLSALFILHGTPQKTVGGNGLKDKRITVVFDENGLMELDITQGVNVTVSIPIIGLQTDFTVPAEATFNLAELIDTIPDLIYGNRVSMQKLLHPEFAGGLLHLDGTNNDGQLESKFETISSNYNNFYHWTANTVAQHGEIIISTDVPKDLFKWEGIDIEYRTGILTTNYIDVVILKQGDLTPIYQTVITSDNVWVTLQITASELSNLGKGDLFVIKLNCVCSGTGSDFVDIGKIKLAYQR